MKVIGYGSMTVGNKRWSIGSLYACLAVIMTVSAFVLVRFGPMPVLSANAVLADGIVGMVEVADRINLVTWWVSGLLLIVVARWFYENDLNVAAKKNNAYFYFAGIVGFIVLAAYTWDVDLTETDNTVPFTVTNLFVGAAVFVVYLFIARSASKLKDGLSKTYLLVISFIAVPILWQAPNAVRDPGHFIYTANEMAAVAAGNFPLADFVPQYSTLLSFPIAPMLMLFPDSPEIVVISWFIAMQIFCIGAPITLAVRTFGWSVLPLGIGLVLIPSIATSISGSTGSAATYFAVMPLRYVGPVALLIVLSWYYKKPLSQGDPILASSKRGFRSDLVLGASCGMVALNNPDFGIPAVGACFLVLIIAAPKPLMGLRHTFFALIGFLGVFLTYSSIGGAIGKPVNWHYWLFFQQVFGSAGYMAVPMPAFGEHIGFVLTFCAGCVIGAVGVARSRSESEKVITSSKQRAIALLYISLWSLGTLAYFSSRSFATTLWGGHIFQLGLTIMFASVYLVGELGNMKSERKTSYFHLLPPVVALFLSGTLLSSLLFGLPPIQGTSAALFGSGGEFPVLAEQAKLMNNWKVRGKSSGQILPMSNLIELRTGVNSLSLFNHPLNLSVSDLFMEEQCKILLKSNVKILYYSKVNRELYSHPQCQQLTGTLDILDPDQLVNDD